MSKHTPGPWLYRAKSDAVYTPPPPDTKYTYGEQIFRFHDEDGPNGEDLDLILAAPDLLEAAQAAWNCIAELAPTQARVEVAQLLQAAIEKAIGEQP